MNINISDLIFDSIVDGPGLRSVLFVQGCSHHCLGCHNMKTWHPDHGKTKSVDQIIQTILEHQNPAFTFSGGEPFEQAKACCEIAKSLKENNYNLWAYSGYTYEQILEDPLKKSFLIHLDVLVDGQFVLDKKSLSLSFKGSSNQRIIDVKASLQANQIILFNLRPRLQSYRKPTGIYL